MDEYRRDMYALFHLKKKIKETIISTIIKFFLNIDIKINDILKKYFLDQKYYYYYNKRKIYKT